MAKQLEQQGAHVHFLSRKERNLWRDATRYQQVQARWIEQQESKGVTDAGGLLQSVSTLLSDSIKENQ
ncbi:MAG: hypothetical protein ACRDD5_13415 [Silvania sp.]